TTSQSFAGFTTDVSIVLNPADLPPGTLFTPGTVIPTQGIFRSAPTPNNGATVGWNFDGAGNDVGPGLTSVTLIVKTDATNFSVGSIGITAGNTVNVAGYAPITGSTVPEPAMFLPAGAALLGLLAFRRRAQSKA
ncbi:MAG: hypothetical protein JOZ22_01450, partial [Acidobacteriia bacterium]|nr:hypothetical protein [Terriglobia bacterium]